MRSFHLSSDAAAMGLPCGTLVGVKSCSRYASGEPEGLRLSKRNKLRTRVGELVPAYTETHRRKPKPSVEFYRSARIKAVALEERQEIRTPLGAFPAERVTFFETGELRRFFPLDGKISGFWSEEEERALAVPLHFDLPVARFDAIIGGACFYRSGRVRSITLFPGERIAVCTAQGEIAVRNGFSLHESGALASLEPAEPTEIKTPIGRIVAFDPDAVGINADSNSLAFDVRGRVTALRTVQNRVAVRTPDGRRRVFSPQEVINPLDGETMIPSGLDIAFDYAANAV
ncbi:MAG: hypothetical protein LBD95_03435, partial [Clostridiales Family XIII bacterium]|nr:hypothetical protein [Clostridiales Family XIII bacterium]